MNPDLFTKLAYDPVKDFVPVAGIGVVPLVLVATNQFPVANLKELVAAAKAKPGGINYAQQRHRRHQPPGDVDVPAASGVNMTHVPYKGGPPALTDLMGGQVQVMFETSVAALPFVKQGRLRALAVSSLKRVPAAPDVPTVAEQGFPGFDGVPWVSLIAPAGTPKPVVDKLNAEVNRILQTPAMRDTFVAQGVEPMAMTQPELSAFIKAEITKWGKAVKDSGAKVE